MRWLCRLVTPPNGLIFDPFTGSGTTGAAARIEGFRFIGAENDVDHNYIEIAERRIAYWERNIPEEYTEETPLDLAGIAALLAATEG